MTFVLGLLGVIAFLASFLLMFVILLQEPKGGGLASALGGSGMDAIGANVGSVNRFTSWVAGVWIGACLLLAVLQPVGADITQAGPSVTPPADAPGGGGTPVPPPAKDE
jgi:preprotein translocase subunit SecG